MADVDIQIVTGKTFTRAVVGGHTVAISWHVGAKVAVTDGTYLTKLHTEAQAGERLITIAMRVAGGGAATVRWVNEGGGDRG